MASVVLLLLPGQNTTIQSAIALYSPASPHLSYYLKCSLMKSFIAGTFGKCLLAYL